MITIWLLRAFRAMVGVFLEGLSIIIPDGIEDDIVSSVLIALDGFGALLDVFVYDSVLRVLVGLLTFAITILAIHFTERVIRRFTTLITGNDYGGRG